MPVSLRYDVSAHAYSVRSGAVRVNGHVLRKALYVYLFLLIPFAYLAAKYDPYAVDGDAVAYMDLADLIHAHRWADAVNGYWNPFYPAVLCLAQVLFKPARANELHAYYTINLFVFVVEIGAVLVFARSLARLRQRVQPHVEAVFTVPALQLIGVALQTTFLVRELSPGKVRPDGLLEALLLLALAMMMEALAADAVARSFVFASAMGLFFGLAYLTKSIAFVLALLAIGLVVLFSWLWHRQALEQALLRGAVALVFFGVTAGPYIAALSHQTHRFDTGDSGALNYAWYVSGTEKLHLQPWMKDRYGTASVRLVHPETELLRSPGVYSYRSFPCGTYPAWFAPAFFHERITPLFSLRKQCKRAARTIVLIARFLVDHPEPLLLLGVLLCAGARLSWSWMIAGPCVFMGAAIWLLYAAVAVEDRYVAIAYVAILLPIFALLTVHTPERTGTTQLQRTAAALLLVYAATTMANLVRMDAENRRNEIVHHAVPAWRDPNVYGAAEGLIHMGLRPGDEIACIGDQACLYDHYWARLTRVRILTEIYAPKLDHLIGQLDATPNRDEVIQTVQRQGARVLVGSFDPGAMTPAHPAASGWVRLGETDFYALPLNVPRPTGAVH